MTAVDSVFSIEDALQVDSTQDSSEEMDSIIFNFAKVSISTPEKAAPAARDEKENRSESNLKKTKVIKTPKKLIIKKTPKKKKSSRKLIIRKTPKKSPTTETSETAGKSPNPYKKKIRVTKSPRRKAKKSSCVED
eukprot:TRINITY_DN5023_c0_g1_i1.p1 TRINITY_DN5023_c0_g1~~TRINITY_DN5023_c0_g1_i1.p1  ORF type:complete len:135 (-),score=36.87 TRINITY_DN5023_c0_g1_i1:96-500(-)